MGFMDGLFSELTRVKKARNARFSSWDHRGWNFEYWAVPPGESLVLGETDGPGCIKRIFLTASCRRSIQPSLIDPRLNGLAAPVNEINPALGLVWDEYEPDFYRKAVIKMTWDGQETPSVLVPLGDFFCIGHSMPGNFQSLPFQVSLKPDEANRFGAPSANTCYLPMPFNKHAKIEIINENDIPFIIAYQIDYELYHEPLPADTPYFHACWNRELPTAGWGPEIQVNMPEINCVPNEKGENNYVLLEAEGCGHYIGCNVSVYHMAGSWWGEGSEMIFIDGEEYPSLIGTGGEDYFNHAWGMQKNSYLFGGNILHEQDSGGYQVSYRFHIPDPIRFENKIRVTFEHGHANHLSDDWSSTAYWYQLLPTGRPLTLPPAQDRLPVRKVLPDIPVKERPPLTPEMEKALDSVKEREKAYRTEHNKMLREKEEKARRDSRLLQEEARKIKEEWDKNK